MFKGWGGGFLHYCIDTVLLKFKQVFTSCYNLDHRQVIAQALTIDANVDNYRNTRQAHSVYFPFVLYILKVVFKK